MIFKVAVISAGISVALLASSNAQNRGLQQRGAPVQQYQQQYQPRVYNSPPPVYSRNTYVEGGRIAGGLAGGVGGTAAGNAAGGPVAGAYAGRVGAVAGGAAGAYYGGQAYDNQRAYTTQRYYAPPAYGVQTTTPYMQRTVPRY